MYVQIHLLASYMQATHRPGQTIALLRETLDEESLIMKDTESDDTLLTDILVTPMGVKHWCSLVAATV